MNIGFIVAAVLALATWGIHTFVGGHYIAKPLLKCRLADEPKYTNYYTWHMVTIVLMAMAGGFAYAAFVPAGRDIAIACTALSASFMILNLGIVMAKKQNFRAMPQWFLFLLITIPALIGLSL